MSETKLGVRFAREAHEVGEELDNSYELYCDEWDIPEGCEDQFEEIEINGETYWVGAELDGTCCIGVTSWQGEWTDEVREEIEWIKEEYGDVYGGTHILVIEGGTSDSNPVDQGEAIIRHAIVRSCEAR